MIERSQWWRGFFVLTLLGTAALGLWLGSRSPVSEPAETIAREEPPAGQADPRVPPGLPAALASIELSPARASLPLDLPLPDGARTLKSHRQEAGRLGEQAAVVEWAGVHPEAAAAYFEEKLVQAGFRIELSPQRADTLARHFVRDDQIFTMTIRSAGKGVRLTLIFRYTVPGSGLRSFSPPEDSTV